MIANLIVYFTIKCFFPVLDYKYADQKEMYLYKVVTETYFIEDIPKFDSKNLTYNYYLI